MSRNSPDAHARLRRVHANAKAVPGPDQRPPGSMWDEAVTPNLSVLAGDSES